MSAPQPSANGDDVVLGYITVPTRDAALAIARAVVEERLAACGNILPAMTSVYHWKDEVRTDEECVLLLKTRRTLTEQLSKRVVELHRYECPCVVFIPIVDGHAPYLQWLFSETARAT